MLQPRTEHSIYTHKATDRISRKSTRLHNTGDNYVTVKTNQGLLDTVCICIEPGKCQELVARPGA